MKTGEWTACCEDVPIDNSLDNYNAVEPMYAAQYLIELKVPGWQKDAAGLLEFVEKNLIFNNISNEPAIQYGARAVSEQKMDHNKMGCHTARYAHTISMYNEAVYDGKNASLTDIAFRCYNWASYMVLSSGLVVVGPAASNNLWFRCGTPGSLAFQHAILGRFLRRLVGAESSLQRSWTCLPRCATCRTGSRLQTICSSTPAHQWR